MSLYQRTGPDHTAGSLGTEPAAPPLPILLRVPYFPPEPGPRLVSQVEVAPGVSVLQGPDYSAKLQMVVVPPRPVPARRTFGGRLAGAVAVGLMLGAGLWAWTGWQGLPEWLNWRCWLSCVASQELQVEGGDEDVGLESLPIPADPTPAPPPSRAAHLVPYIVPLETGGKP